MRVPPPLALTGDPDERNYKSPRFQLGSLTTISLVHDYICPWCYAGFLHARRLHEAYGVTFDWRSAELIPAEMNYTPAPPKPPDPNAPPRPPGRFDRFLEVEGITMRSPRPAFVPSHKALLGAEYAWIEAGTAAFDTYNEAIYRAFWERHEDISNLDVLVRLAEGAGLDTTAFADAIRSERYADNILPFDDAIYAIGVRHVPTFLFGAEEQLAEANYSDLAHATERFLVWQERLRSRK